MTAATTERAISTEDTATILLRFEGGARGAVSISQISPGRKNSLRYEVDGSGGAIAWDSEEPDRLWLGHRERANEILLKNPALMGEEAQRAAVLPAGHVEGFADTFGALFRAIYTDVVAGAPAARPPYATFADGHDEMLIGDAILESAHRGDLGRGRSRRRHPGGFPRMKLGFLTAPLPDLELGEIATWAAGNGFESLEIACWPRTTGSARRYAGTSHIDVADLSAGRASEIRDEVTGTGLTHLRPRLLPQPAAPGPRDARGGDRPHQAGHRGGRRRWASRS